MATATAKARCVTCAKEKSTVRCDGCFQSFCYNHLEEHRQELSKRLDEIEVSHDLLRQMLTEQMTKPESHALIQQIDRWERDSIEKIRQTAEELRQSLLKDMDKHFTSAEMTLNNLTAQLRISREENDFFETDLQQWENQLTQLKEELNKPSTVAVIRDSTPLVTKIYVDTSPQLYVPNIHVNMRWIQGGITVAGNNGMGYDLNQLWTPYGLCVDYDQTVYIADYGNHRIMEWKRGAVSGQVIAGGNGRGSRNDQLHHPTHVVVDKETDSLIICDRGNKRVVRWPLRNSGIGEIIISDIDCHALTMDNNRYLYVSDYSKHEVRRWKLGDTSEIVVAGGNGKGNRLDQLSGPTYIFIDQDHSMYVMDSDNYRVMKWMEGANEGTVVAGGQGRGKSLTQLFNPGGIAVDQLGTIYVADYKNDRVMSWSRGATQGRVVVGGKGCGTASNRFNGPWDLSFDRQNNLYIVDYWNHRVQKFCIDSNLI